MKPLALVCLLLSALVLTAVPAAAQQQVEVTNDVLTPVPVTPAVDAVQEQAVVTLSPRQPTATITWKVPEDRQLMIEWVSVRISMPVNQIPDVRLRTASRPLGPGTNSVFHQIGVPGPPKPNINETRATHERSQTVKLYAMPGSDVTLFLARDVNSGTAQYVVSWTGRLIDPL